MNHADLASGLALDVASPDDRAHLRSQAALRGRCPPPSRCPYCAVGTPIHWIRWGYYERYAGDPDDPSRRVAVPRYQCKFTERTFSLLPDALLPYCSLRTAIVLSCLHGLFVRKEPLSTLARRMTIRRSTLRHLSARYLRTVLLLRLPSRAGPLHAAAFLKVLIVDGRSTTTGSPQETIEAIIHLFRTWKEREPKHSVVGIYAR